MFRLQHSCPVCWYRRSSGASDRLASTKSRIKAQTQRIFRLFSIDNYSTFEKQLLACCWNLGTEHLTRGHPVTMQSELLITNGAFSDQPIPKMGCAQRRSVITRYKRAGLERPRRYKPFTGAGGSGCTVFFPSVTCYGHLGVSLTPS